MQVPSYESWLLLQYRALRILPFPCSTDLQQEHASWNRILSCSFWGLVIHIIQPVATGDLSLVCSILYMTARERWSPSRPTIRRPACGLLFTQTGWTACTAVAKLLGSTEEEEHTRAALWE